MFRTRGSSIEAPGAGSVAWVAKGNKIIFDFVYLCPSTVPCLRGRVVRPTTRQFQKLHVVPDVPHDFEHIAMPDLTVLEKGEIGSITERAGLLREAAVDRSEILGGWALPPDAWIAVVGRGGDHFWRRRIQVTEGRSRQRFPAE